MKKSFFRVLQIVAIILIIFALIVIIFDPFIHYHKPFFNLKAAQTDERQAMSGVAKNLDYETALIGSSMSENFRVSWFRDYFGKTVKLCLQGAHFSDYDVMLKTVTKKDDVKNIIFSLDTYLLTNDPKESPVTVPEYMYNNNPFDDVYYLLNISVLTEYLPKFIFNNIDFEDAEDEAYAWDKDYEFSEREALNSYIPKRPLVKADMKSYDSYFEYTDEFLEGICPYIENNPDITFYFYTSPYSMLFWDFSLRNGDLEAEICALERAYSKLLEYDNVRIFYFQDNLNIAENIDNYRDYSHFHGDINKYMCECFKTGECEVTKDTYFDRLLSMYEYALNYDYEPLFH